MPNTIETHHVRDFLVEAVPWVGIGTLVWKIIRANTAAEQLLGYAPQEIIGVAIDELVPPEYAAQYKVAMERFAKHPHNTPLGRRGPKIHLRRKNGEVIEVEVGLYGNKEMFDKGFVVVVLQELHTSEGESK